MQTWNKRPESTFVLEVLGGVIFRFRQIQIDAPQYIWHTPAKQEGRQQSFVGHKQRWAELLS